MDMTKRTSLDSYSTSKLKFNNNKIMIYPKILFVSFVKILIAIITQENLSAIRTQQSVTI